MTEDRDQNGSRAFHAEALELDAHDPLAQFRGRFFLPPNTIYLDGNSLGPLCVDAEAALQAAVATWKLGGIEGWTNGPSPWFTMAERLGARVAALLGAESDAVVVTGSTTTNLHQLLATLLRPEPGTTVVTDASAFPSDLYAIKSSLALRGLDASKALRLVNPDRHGILQEGAIIEAMHGAQMVILPAVVYTTGQLLDMARLTTAAHEIGVIIGFDCAHSVGSVPHELDQWGVDFAFWCSYKYLNGGPGAAGGLYLNRRHWQAVPGLAGWFGAAKEIQMKMTTTLVPADSAGRLQIGTPNILSMAPIDGSLTVIEEAGLPALRLKSLTQTDFMLRMLHADPAFNCVSVVSPLEVERRGGHITIQHPGAAGLSQALRTNGVIPDYRPPDMVRLAPAPLYISFQDCFQAVQQLKLLLQDPSGWQDLQPGLVP